MDTYIATEVVHGILYKDQGRVVNGFLLKDFINTRMTVSY